MLSSVLRGDRAIEVNIAIMRVFVRLRRLLDTNEAFRLNLRSLEPFRMRSETEWGRCISLLGLALRSFRLVTNQSGHHDEMHRPVGSRSWDVALLSRLPLSSLAGKFAFSLAADFVSKEIPTRLADHAGESR